MAIKLSDPRTFRPIVTVVAVVIAPFFVAIIIASRSGRGRRGLVDVVGAQRRRSRAGVVRAGRSRSLCSRPSTKSRAQRRDMSLLVG